MGDREEEACRGDGSQRRCDGGPDLSRHRKKQTYISCPIRTGNLSQMPHGLKAPQRSRDGPLSPCPLFLSYHGTPPLPLLLCTALPLSSHHLPCPSRAGSGWMGPQGPGGQYLAWVLQDLSDKDMGAVLLCPVAICLPPPPTSPLTNQALQRECGRAFGSMRGPRSPNGGERPGSF